MYITTLITESCENDSKSHIDVHELTQNVHPGGEQALSFFRIQTVNKICVVVIGSFLVPQDETPLDSLGHLGGHVVHVLLQVLDGDLLLVDVGSVSSSGQT